MVDTVKIAPSVCVGQEQITSLAASAPLAAIPGTATGAILKSRVQGFYLRLTGGAATSADMAITVDVPVEVTSDLADVRVLQQAATAVVDVWYFQ